MNICRTRFKKDIVTEFIPPRNRRSTRVMIFCSGVPGVPHKDEVLEHFALRGYWTFFPRYRGTWESGGTFLERSPEEDILDVIDSLRSSFKDYWSGETYKLTPKFITIVGTSFGGPAALLAARDPRVYKAICISPVVDWIAEDKADPLDNLYEILRDGYGAAYRLNKRSWNKLGRGNFYNPVKHMKEIDHRKVLIFHAKDDDVVKFRPVERFSRRLGCKLVALKEGGHLSSSMLMSARYCRLVERFMFPSIARRQRRIDASKRSSLKLDALL